MGCVLDPWVPEGPKVSRLLGVTKGEGTVEGPGVVEGPMVAEDPGVSDDPTLHLSSSLSHGSPIHSSGHHPQNNRFHLLVDETH